MAISRHFLGWDAPVVEKVRDRLLKISGTKEGELLDLEGLLIVVPTRQAERRLKESLARWCLANNTAMVSAYVVQPSSFFSPKHLSANVADLTVATAVWIQVMMDNDLAGFSSLLPNAPGDRDFQWALNTSRIIKKLRTDLANGAFTIDTILKDYGEHIQEELERWQDLANLERLYLDRLKKLGFEDLCLCKIERAETPVLEQDTNKIIVAAVPDPTLLAVKAIESLAETYEVEVLVHAPPELRDDFDKLGRPDKEKWAKKTIEIPEWNSNVFLEANPAAQSRRLLKEIENSTDLYESGEIAVGVPDKSVIPFLERDLSAAGLPAFDPSDKRVSDHALGRLCQRAVDLLQLRTYNSTASLLRHPDFVQFLERNHELESEKFLGQLDRFQNYYLPVSFSSMLRPFEDNPTGTRDKRDNFTELGKALNVIQTCLKLFEEKEFEDAWRLFLQEVYQGRKLKRSETRDAEFENAASELEAELRKFRDLGEAGKGLSVVQLSAIFVGSLNDRPFHRERREEIIDLEGWLELPWNPAPFLLVTGMNDESVPGGSVSDAFLPDSFRNVLNLLDDTSRFARDIFFMKGMIESRPEPAHSCFIVGKTHTSGDPLRPSRLMFRCEDKDLPSRAEQLFHEIKDTRDRPHAEVVFALKPASAAPEADTGLKSLHVTAFRDYLACPFRFYLKHVLGMEEQDDDKTGLDDLDFGNIVHGAAEVMGHDKSLWACPDADKLAKRLGDIANERITARFGSPTPLGVQVSLMAARERLKAMAHEQVRLVAEGWTVKEAEDDTTKSRVVQRAGFSIRGRIDRIDENTKDGRIRIIDYKTSNDPLNPK